MYHLPAAQPRMKQNNIRRAMASIEKCKPELLGVLPQEEYDRFTRSDKNRGIPKDLLKLFSDT